MSIEISNASYTYALGTPFAKTALSDINLRIDEGSVVGIIGHTGSGKSTLVQLMNGLLQPTAGTVIVDGDDTNDKHKRRGIRQRVGLVFQYPEYQLFEETVARDIAFAPTNAGCDNVEVQRRVHSALRLVGLGEDCLQRSPFALSGGQKRRVAIAGVLASQPRYLVLDEPTAGLDPRGRNDILSQLMELRRQTRMSIVLVSHSMEDVALCCEYVYVMHGGRVAMSGTPHEVFAHADQLSAIGLSAPEVTLLMREVYGVNVCTIEEALEVICR